jgi:hypothetical protein
MSFNFWLIDIDIIILVSLHVLIISVSVPSRDTLCTTNQSVKLW